MMENHTIVIGLILVIIVLSFLLVRSNRKLVNAKELILFRIHWEDNRYTGYIIMREDTHRMLVASQQLHHNPGKNPHNGNEARTATKITVLTQTGIPKTADEYTPGGPYWWTTPGLKNNYDHSRGARIFDNSIGTTELKWSEEEKVLWVRPE